MSGSQGSTDRACDDEEPACAGHRRGHLGGDDAEAGTCFSSSPPPAIGTVADSGFRPGSNGFTFNYGDTLTDGPVPTNLTPADVQKLFGTVVCADAAIAKCDLIPEAQAWMDQTNQEMADGHCFGFSVAANLVWRDKVNTTAYEADTTGSTAASRVNLQMTRSTEQGVQVVSHGAIPLAGGDSAELQFGTWTDPSQGIPWSSRTNGERSTQTPTDQATG
jgi:hypothetical protein